MKCEQYRALFTDWENNRLTETEQQQLEQHLDICPACREELADLKLVWDKLGKLETPEPSETMRVNFQAMLADYKESVYNKKRSSLSELIANLWQRQPRWPLAYSLMLILICFGAAFWFVHSSPQQKQMQELTNQVHELKKTMMLALLENPSASERIRGVSYTSNIRHVDTQVINALFATLNNDPNVNVRLSTLEALTHLAGYPEVRQGLIQSIAEQDSPIMQSAIADVMLKLQEKKSVKPLKKLLKQKDLNPAVREKISETINRLI